jgi:predicted metalloprotease with PDZ domain
MLKGDKDVGISVVKTEDKFYVSGVNENSSATRAGFAVGDRLRAYTTDPLTLHLRKEKHKMHKWNDDSIEIVNKTASYTFVAVQIQKQGQVNDSLTKI